MDARDRDAGRAHGSRSQCGSCSRVSGASTCVERRARRPCDYRLDGPLAAWQSMFDDIVARTAARPGCRRINSLALLGDDIALRGDRPDGSRQVPAVQPDAAGVLRRRGQVLGIGGRAMSAPNCPNCGKPVRGCSTLPYGWWEWHGDRLRDAYGRRRHGRCRALGALRLHGRAARLPSARLRRRAGAHPRDSARDDVTR